MIDRIATAAPLLARHAGAYGELIADEVLRASQAFAQRLWVGVALAMAALVAVLLSCTLLIARSWDSPGRLETIGALAGFFILVSLLAGVILYVLQTRPMRLLHQTQQEWNKDRLVMEDLFPGTAADAQSRNPVSTLAQTRAQLRAILQGEKPAQDVPPDTFPRSRTFRWALSRPVTRLLGSGTLNGTLMRILLARFVGTWLLGRKS
jgi:uncharacterized membrane protein YqjE